MSLPSASWAATSTSLAGNFFERRHGVCILGIVAPAGRELAVAQGAQLAAQGLDRDLDAELIPDPRHQVHQAPARDTMDRRDRAALDHLNQRLALAGVQLGDLTWRLRVDQTARPAPVEAKHPVANRLQPDAADPCRIATRTAVLNLSQGQETTKSIRVAQSLGQTSKRCRIEIVPKSNRRCHGKPPVVCHGESHQLRAAQHLK